MAVTSNDLLSLSRELAEIEERLRHAKENYEHIRSLGFGYGYNITISSNNAGMKPVLLPVAAMNRERRPQIIRGRDMIHLGVLKTLEGEVRYWEDQAHAMRQKISDYTGKEK